MNTNMKMNLGTIASPLGNLLLVSDDREQVRALDFEDHAARMRRLLRESYGAYELTAKAPPAAIAAALERYFHGELNALDAIVTSSVGTDLQWRVWDALRRIPPGETMSYGELAVEVGIADPRGAIEVGAANGANPISIIVPCHRVIGKNGDLKGYAGGVHRKRWLLEHEGALTSAARPAITLELPGL